MPTGTSIVASTSPAIKSPANQTVLYSFTICSPGSQRFQRFMVSSSCSTLRSSEVVALEHAYTCQGSRYSCPTLYRRSRIARQRVDAELGFNREDSNLF